MKLAIFIVCLGIANAENSFQLFQGILKKPSSSSFAGNKKEQLRRTVYLECERSAGRSPSAVIIAEKTKDVNALNVETWKTLLNQEIIDNFCIIVNSTKSCVFTRGETIPVPLDKIIGGFDHFCSDRKLYNAIPCYQKVYNETEQVCHSNEKCGGKKGNLENTPIQTTMHLQEGLDIFCTYAACMKQCRHQKLVEECGKEKAVALYTLERKALKIMSDVNEYTLPTSCNSLSVEEDD